MNKPHSIGDDTISSYALSVSQVVYSNSFSQLPLLRFAVLLPRTCSEEYCSARPVLRWIAYRIAITAHGTSSIPWPMHCLLHWEDRQANERQPRLDRSS